MLTELARAELAAMRPVRRAQAEHRARVAAKLAELAREGVHVAAPVPALPEPVDADLVAFAAERDGGAAGDDLALAAVAELAGEASPSASSCDVPKLEQDHSHYLRAWAHGPPPPVLVMT